MGCFNKDRLIQEQHVITCNNMYGLMSVALLLEVSAGGRGQRAKDVGRRRHEGSVPSWSFSCCVRTYITCPCFIFSYLGLLNCCHIIRQPTKPAVNCGHFSFFTLFVRLFIQIGELPLVTPTYFDWLLTFALWIIKNHYLPSCSSLDAQHWYWVPL